MADPRRLPTGEPDLIHLAFLVAPTLSTWVLRHHTDDGAGRCAACINPNTNWGQPWPCALHVAARRAREVDIAAAQMTTATATDTPPTAADLRRRVHDRWFTRSLGP